MIYFISLRYPLLLLLISVAITATFGENSSDSYDTLAGPLPPLVKARKNPYIVVTNIEVPPQKTVTIEPGVQFLFKNFSGLHIRGRLIARATVDYPIIFTSEFDRSCNKESLRDANPFDWDGIYMTNDALGSQLAHCEIRYSVYGLISDTKLIRLDPVTFKDNGKSAIVIENEEIQFGNEPFRHVLDQNDPELLKNAVEFVPDPLQAKRTALRLGSFITVLGGIGVTAVFGYYRYHSYNELKALSSEEFDNINRDNGSSSWKNARKEWIKNMIISDSGLLLTALGMYGVRVSFTF
ncbi:MAG TPA: hypothetical protein VHO70_11040 [Chitinispirillaceae bacterium]|nr:hypothetical protein [Chitinispirillaceae bacterium]